MLVARTAILIALTHSLIPDPATAQPKLDLVWSATTGGGATGTSTIDAMIGDTLELDVVVTIDSLGFTSATWDLVGTNDLTAAANSLVVAAGGPPECPSPPNIVPGTCFSVSFKTFEPTIVGVTDTGSSTTDYDIGGLTPEFAPSTMILGRGVFTVGGDASALEGVSTFFAPGVGGVTDGAFSYSVPAVSVATINVLDSAREEHEGQGIPIEYSDEFDDRAIAGGGDHDKNDPGQVLRSHFPLVPLQPLDSTDFFPATETGTTTLLQVDALSHEVDAFATDLIADQTDLVISLDLDAGVDRVAAYYQTPGGNRDVAFRHSDLNQDLGPPGEGDVDDVDALNLWGPAGQANGLYYSAENDFDNVYSVFHFDLGFPVGLVSQATIVSVVESLDYVGDTTAVDVDAMMFQNLGSKQAFDPGDRIIFSIRAAGNFDGGEVISWRNGDPPEFLQHAGVTFDTDHDVSSSFGLFDGVQEIDALEAGPVLDALGLPTPVPIPIWLSVTVAGILGASGMGALRRRG